MEAAARARGERVGRYALFDRIGSGGMATVHLGRLVGPVGFTRTVAIKRLLPHMTDDPSAAAMFLDEARVAARIHHPNVVSTLDVIEAEDDLLVVMEYVHGEALSRLVAAAERDGEAVPLPVASAILCGVLTGLHSAHEATNDRGEPLRLVHRDVSPHNILVGVDGVSRVLDFGIAKASGRVQVTQEGQVKGKIAYMAPEQLRGLALDRRADLYAAGVVLWELLTLRRLFTGQGEDEHSGLTRLLARNVPPPSSVRRDVPPEIDRLVLRALAIDPANRFETAAQMAVALERATGPASPRVVGEWVEALAADALARRSAAIAAIERGRPRTAALDAEPDPHSQGSDVSVATPVQTPPSRNRWPWFALAALCALGGGGLLVTHWRPSSRHAPDAPPIGDAAQVSLAASSNETPTPTPTATVVAPSSAPTIDKTAPVGRSMPASKPRTPPTRASSASTPATPPGCDPPFYTDAAGVRRYKPECPLE